MSNYVQSMRSHCIPSIPSHWASDSIYDRACTLLLEVYPASGIASVEGKVDTRESYKLFREETTVSERLLNVLVPRSFLRRMRAHLPGGIPPLKSSINRNTTDSTRTCFCDSCKKVVEKGLASAIMVIMLAVNAVASEPWARRRALRINIHICNVVHKEDGAR